VVVFKALFTTSLKPDPWSIGLDARDDDSSVYGEFYYPGDNEDSTIYKIGDDLAWTSLNYVAISPLSQNLISEVEIPDWSVYRPLVPRAFASGVFERHPGEYQNRLAVLFGPSDSAAYKEFLTIVVCIISNNLIYVRDVRAEQLLEWVTQQSGMDLHRLLDFDLPTIQASLEFLLKVAILSNGRKNTAGKALLAADTRRKLFSGRSLKLLEAAVIFEDQELIQELIEKGVLIDHLPRVNELFIQAVSENQVELIRFWLQHGASLETPNLISTMYTYGSLAAWKLILTGGAIDVDQDMKFLDILVTKKDLQLFVGPGYITAAGEKLSLLLKTRSGKQVLSSCDLSSKFLNSAAVAGQLEVVQCLVESGADVNLMGGIFDLDNLRYGSSSIGKSSTYQIPSRPITCLFGAAVAGRTKVIQFLVRSGAVVNYQLPGDHPRTALEAALLNGHHDVALLLVQAGAICSSLDMRSIDDLAVTEAAKAGNLELVRALILNGANPSFILEAWEPHEGLDNYTPNTELVDLFLWAGG